MHGGEAEDNGADGGEHSGAEVRGVLGLDFEVAGLDGALDERGVHADSVVAEGVIHGVFGGVLRSVDLLLVGHTHVESSDSGEGSEVVRAHGHAGELEVEGAGRALQREGLVAAGHADQSVVRAPVNDDGGRVGGVSGGFALGDGDVGAGRVRRALASGGGFALGGRRGGRASRSRSGGDRFVGCEVDLVLGVVFADLLVVVSLGSQGACGYALELRPLPTSRANEAPVLAVVGDAVSTV